MQFKQFRIKTKYSDSPPCCLFRGDLKLLLEFQWLLWVTLKKNQEDGTLWPLTFEFLATSDGKIDK